MAMKRRERILGGVVGGVAALVVCVLVVNTTHFQPLKDVDAKIAQLKEKIEKKKDRLKREAALMRRWRSIQERTIADNYEEAKRKLVSRVNKLLTVANMPGATVAPKGTAASNRRKEHLSVALTLTTDDTLARIVSFLEMLYQEPYKVRMKSIMLDPRDKGDAMKMGNCRIEALVLGEPELSRANKDIDRSAWSPESEPSKAAGAYDSICLKNVFRPGLKAVEDHAEVTKSPSTVEDAGSTHEVYSSGPGRPGDLVGVAVMGAEGGIYLRNQVGTDWYKIGQRIEGRTLVFVHPLGMVLRESPDRDVFVELGHNIDQLRVLTAEHCPELYEKWQESISTR